jgi:hypothetical protein
VVGSWAFGHGLSVRLVNDESAPPPEGDGAFVPRSSSELRVYRMRAFGW